MIDWMMAGVALFGTYLNLKKNRAGFALWMISNLYWMIHNFSIDEYAQCLLYAAFLGLAIWGFLAWKTEESQNSQTLFSSDNIPM